MKNYTKEEFISIIESTLIPSLNSIELERNSVSDYQNRFISRNANIAELYHENSKLTSFNKNFIVRDEHLIEEIKKWYLTTTCKVNEEDIDRTISGNFFKPIESLPSNFQKFFKGFLGGEGYVEALYSIDLLFLYENSVYRIIPYSEYLILEKRFNDGDVRRFYLSILDIKETYNAYFILVGIPWRQMVFKGTRGYKNMLIEAGMLINSISQIVKINSLSMKVYNDFLDNYINRLFSLDGVESYALSIISLNPKS